MAPIAPVLAGTLFIGLLFPHPSFGPENDTAITTRKFQAIRLKYASARVVADTLTTRFGENARIAFDAATNTVYIQANAETVPIAEGVATRFDHRCRPAEGTTVFRLRHADAIRTANIIKAIVAVLVLVDDDWECRFVASYRTNAIIISARSERAEKIRAILRWLDVCGGATDSR